MIVNLHSVGSCIDSETHVVYPLSDNGDPCLDNEGVHIMEVSDEFLDTLSEEDFKSILALTYSESEEEF